MGINSKNRKQLPKLPKKPVEKTEKSLAAVRSILTANGNRCCVLRRKRKKQNKKVPGRCRNIFTAVLNQSERNNGYNILAVVPKIKEQYYVQCFPSFQFRLDGTPARAVILSAS